MGLGDVIGKPLGEKQLDFLVAHWRSPGVPTRFKPTRTGRPNVLMQSLAHSGLIWIERREVVRWHPPTDGWLGEKYRTYWVFGLTVAGQTIANRVPSKNQMAS